MEWLASNWVLLALLGACVAMHLFGHGRHEKEKKPVDPAGRSTEVPGR